MRAAKPVGLVLAMLVGWQPLMGQSPPKRKSVQEILAAERGETPEVRALVAGKDPNARDQVHRRTALMWSIFLADEIAFERLIAVPGADVNAVDDRGDTALLHAAEFAMKYDTTPMVEALLAHGARIAPISEGRDFTPLMHAANGNAPGVTQALLAKLGAKELERRNAEGMTALAIGAMVGATEVVRLLLEKGAQIDSRDDAGKTALIHAAGHVFPGTAATVALLLEKGANPKLKDQAGNTALSEARRRGVADVVALLEKAGTP